MTRHFQKDLLSNTDANFIFSDKAKQLISKTYVFPQQFQVLVQAHFLKKERFGFNPKSIYPVNVSEITYEIKVHTVPSLEFTGAKTVI